MKNKIINFINNKKGETFVSLTIVMWVIIIIFICIIFILPIYNKQHTLEMFAKTILRQAEIDGTVEQDECYNDLCELYHINPTITWEWDKYKGTKKVQLNHLIKVYLEDEYIFNVGIFKEIKTPLNAKAYGKSEIYWK